MTTSKACYQVPDRPNQCVCLHGDLRRGLSGSSVRTALRLLVRVAHLLLPKLNVATLTKQSVDHRDLAQHLAYALVAAGAWLALALSVLIPADAAAHACTQPPQGMVAWWPMDEVSGTTVADIVGSNPGARVNGPISALGLVGGSLRFNGGGRSYVVAPDSDLWAFGASDFSIELWANWDFDPVGSIGHPGSIFIGNDEGAGTTNKWFFALGGGYLNFHINGPSIGAAFFPLVPFSPTVGQWYHLAVTRKGNVYVIYVNGVLSGSATESRSIPNPNSALTIGQAESLGFVNGRLDEITVYNRALSQGEIQGIFNAGNAGKCKGLLIATSSLPAIEYGKAFSTTLTTAFGQPPYFWNIASGYLPSGAALSSDGVLSGTPTEAGNFSVAVQVTDGSGHAVTKDFVQQVLLAALPPTLRVRKSGTSVVPGRTVDYIIVVENTGISTATDVNIVEAFDPLRQFKDPSSVTPYASILGNTINWNIPILEPGNAAVLTYSVTIAPSVKIGELVRGGAYQVCDACKDIDACHFAGTICDNVPDPFPIPKTWLDILGRIVGESLPSSTCIAVLAECAKVCEAKCPHGSDDKPAQGAIDPNEKIVVGPRFIRSGQPLVYGIHFENIGTIEARDVFITDVLDRNLDPSRVTLLTTEGGVFDATTRTIKWSLLNTNLPPGGSGSVRLSVYPRPALPSGTIIRNTGVIQFEVFEPMTTNEILSTIDDIPPHCAVTPLPRQTTSPTFAVSWIGTDSVGEIDSYSVSVSDDGSEFKPLLQDTKNTSLVFEGLIGHRYGFLCVAKDTAGNIEVKPAVAEATTLVASAMPGDVNGDGSVNCADLQVIKASFGKRKGQVGFDPRADMNSDGIVDVKDLAFVAQKLRAGTVCK